MNHSHLMAPKQFRLDSSYKTSEFWWHLGKILWSLLRMRLRVKYWHPCTRERSKEGLAEKAPCKYLWKHQGWVGSWYIVVYLIDDGQRWTNDDAVTIVFYRAIQVLVRQFPVFPSGVCCSLSSNLLFIILFRIMHGVTGPRFYKILESISKGGDCKVRQRDGWWIWSGSEVMQGG